jgi:hypothetical protein
MTPLDVTRANVWRVTCPDEGGLDAFGAFDRAPEPRRSPLERFAVTSSTRSTPARKAAGAANRRRFKKADREEDFFFMAKISDQLIILVLFGNLRQQVSFFHCVVAMWRLMIL